MTGIVAGLINKLVKNRLPNEIKETEVVHATLQAEREVLKTATNRLLEELVNSTAMETMYNVNPRDE